MNSSSIINNSDIDLTSLLGLSSASAEAGGGYSCTATKKCKDSDGNADGEVSCTGTILCSRGTDYVRCDGHKTSC